LITLQLWHPQATLGDLLFNKAPFRIQVHGLPLINMTTKIAISIGKGLGNLIKVDVLSGVKTTFKSFLRLLVEIEMDNPLKLGFSFCRDGGDPLWIFLKCERLDIYCSSCGRIGHKSITCMAAPEERTPDRYAISLKVNIYSNLLPSSSTSRTNPAIVTSQTTSSNPQILAIVSTLLSGAYLTPNPKAQTQLTPTTSFPKWLKISSPNLLLADDMSQPITSLLNDTSITLSTTAGQDIPAMLPTIPHIHPISQPSKQPSLQPSSLLDPNQVDHGPSLSIFLHFSRNNSLSLSPASEHTFTSIVLTDSQKTLAKKAFTKIFKQLQNNQLTKIFSSISPFP
jgi:hypothetical protein